MARREIFCRKLEDVQDEHRGAGPGEGPPRRHVRDRDARGRGVPAVALGEAVADLCRGTKISVGMQNMHFEQEGAFTGEVSPVMVKDAGCRYVLIGHSERRHVFGETDDEVNKKVRPRLKNGIEPMICVGELLEEREKGLTNEVLKRQVDEGPGGSQRRPDEKGRHRL